MTLPVPPQAVVGEPLPAPAASAEALARLLRRRSTPAQTLTGPGPDPAALELILRAGARTPDHGKLFPWRFLVIEPQDKAELVRRLEPLAVDRPDPEKARNALQKLARPPVSVAVISRVVPGHKIPEVEQMLSAGAVCMNMLHAADALGFGANWITDWYAYDPRALTLLGLVPGEALAGFLHFGTQGAPPPERDRPDLGAMTGVWRP